MVALVTQKEDLSFEVTISGGIVVKATEHELTALAAAKAANDQMRDGIQPQDVDIENIDLDMIVVTEEDMTEIDIERFDAPADEGSYKGGGMRG